MIKPPPEKLGSFYLGATYDVDRNKINDEILNYDARDLTTHAICVGMTGSGKTGLCVGLLEEAALDKIPAMIIDPKGDMTNLLLQFEDLKAKSFKPWINVDDAKRKDLDIDTFAERTASQWKEGLKKWGQGPERIQQIRKSVEYTIYTPGSSAGIPINILGSFTAPQIDFEANLEMLTERIQGNVAALLGMINRKEDPSRSREGILLSKIFEHHWRKEESLDLSALILSIQNPPVKKLGVFDVDTFFPENDRFELAMEFNNLIASPQFAYWLKGEPLDIEKIYFTSDGKPRHSIFYIAHLSEQERMFFVTLLLNSLITWMRGQSGTTSLRSLIYFDELFGYFPPVANPPSKKPLLTLLKQARAYGVGTVLVTQNPVDIDYKGLSNAGTWFIGKLQTERDKKRVLEGLKGAIAESGSSDQFDFEQLITSLSSRVFLMHNVHEDEPVVFHTRWVMSYLRGPLTRTQVKVLMEQKKDQDLGEGGPKLALAEKSKSNLITSIVPPSVDPAVNQKFLTIRTSVDQALAALETNKPPTLHYEPMTLGLGQVRFFDQKRDIDQIQEFAQMAGPPDEFGRVEWSNAIAIDDWKHELVSQPDQLTDITVTFGAVPESLNTGKEISKVKKDFSDWIYHNQELPIQVHPKLNLFQELTESPESFQMRVLQAARENRDKEIDALQDKYEDDLERISDRIRREEIKLDDQKAELQHRKTAEIVGVAETIFSVFAGRRRRSLSGVTTKSRMRRKASQRVEAIEEELENLHEDYTKLEQELEGRLAQIARKWEKSPEEIEVHKITPRRADVMIDQILLIWAPIWVGKDGRRISAR